MALLHVDFKSDTLGMRTEMDVILPEYSRRYAGEKVKTLFLLHGLSDDQTTWHRNTSVERYVMGRRLAVVMPSVNLGFYTDMYRGNDYFSFVSKELIEKCRRFFPMLSDKREDTFVAGLSMGGYGAIKCALKRPEVFSKCAAFSSAADAEALMSCEYHCARGRYWIDVFGPEDGVRGSENDLFAAASSIKDPKLKPEFYIWCGTEDFLYAHNTRLRDHLRSLDFNVKYEEEHGDHQWKYWDEKLKVALDFMLGDGKGLDI